VCIEPITTRFLSWVKPKSNGLKVYGYGCMVRNLV
jgi:hypothetical protein